MSKELTYKDIIAFHPGSYVEEIIDDLNITQKEFAGRLGVSEKTVSKIVNCEEPISQDMANKLSKITGVSIQTWLQLQTMFDIKVIEIKDKMEQDEKEICNLIDFKYFKCHGLVIDKPKYTWQEKVRELRRILKVTNLSMLNDFNESVSYRSTNKDSEKQIVNSNVMLELAMDKAKDLTDNKYDKKKLKSYFEEIRGMTVKKPEEFYTKLKEILLECGIALVGLPHLKSAGLHGATKKFKNGSIMLLITDRNKYADVFWFSLLHELGHIYYGDFKSNNKNLDYDEKEQRADTFARDFLISEEKYNTFLDNGNFSEAKIKEYSNELCIHPSILLGRLQNEGYVPYDRFTDLKEQYVLRFD